MKILKAIGSFFVKIWRWIKNTAWVQPLLIVGAIFGVIFSIPAITSGIQGLINANNSADKFYRSFQKSMEGGTTSSAEKLLDNYYSKETDSNFNLPDNEKKYFIMFTASNNSTANDIKPGFQILKDNWNSFSPVGNYPFRLYTVYTDEITTQTTKTKSAFSQFMETKNWFFEKAATVGLNSQYFLNNQSMKSDLEKMGGANPDDFVCPTIILVDWTKTVTENVGITEVIFSIPGANNYAKAQFLSRCWNCQKEFKEPQ